jgi:hypothetical protein
MTFCKVGPFFMFKWTGLTVFKFVYFILCQISILYVISLNPGKRKKRPDAGCVAIGNTKVTIAITIIQV